MKTKIAILITAVLVVALYLFGLDLVPPHLNQDEMMFGLNAYSIAKYGRDFYGNPYPFYFWHLGSFWATPVVVYVTSLFLKFLPFSEWSIRVPGALIGIISILLTAILAKRIFKNSLYSLLALVVAGTVPALFINFRIAMDVAWTILFVLLWLILLKVFSDKGSLVAIFLSGLALGIGLHSYHAAKIIMPMYYMASLLYCFMVKKAKFINLLLLTLGFVIPIIAFIPWLTAHPDTLLNQVSYVSSLDKSVKVGSGIWGVFNFDRLKDFISNYFTYFSAKILFVEGDRSLIHSTGRVGAFTFGVAFLLLFGIVETIRRRGDWFAKLILLGFLTYPIAPAIVNDSQRISRGLIVVPFIVLLSLYGINFMLSQKEKIFRYLTYGLLVFSILEFTLFLVDYFGDYRVRSMGWFNNNIGGLYESVIKSTQIRKVDRIYIDSNIYFAENYFDFNQIKYGKNLKDKTLFFNPKFEDFTKFPKGTIVAIQAGDLPTKPDKIGGFEKIETIRELNGYETFLVYHRD